MKKVITLILSLLIVVSLTACGSSQKPSSEANSNVQNSTQNTQEQTNPVQKVFKAATSSQTGAYATITLSADVKLDDTSAWLGLCPAGKNYITEEEADDVDVIWFAFDGREENDPYVFSCDFSEVEDGTYALVVTSSDDGAVGYVVLQLLMTKDGEKLTFDYTDAKLNVRPADLETAAGKTDMPTEEPEKPGDEPEDEPTEELIIEGDPAEYGMEYWEEKFPGENICPFYIDEDGVERSYYWVSSFDGWDGTMNSWIEQPFNWNGWHKTEDGFIVNEDETLKITESWANGDEGMSSYCTVTTEKYEKAE